MKVVFAILCCALVAAYLIVGGYYERQRGLLIQRQRTREMLMYYVEKNEGSWPASLDDLKTQGFISQEPVNGYYRYPGKTPLTIGDSTIDSPRLIPEFYLRCINYGVVKHMDELEIVHGQLCRIANGEPVELFVNKGLPPEERLGGANRIYEVWQDRRLRGYSSGRRE